MRTATIARPRASTPKRILILLNIRPGEGRRVAWMIVYSAAATGGMFTLSVATASTLFLSGLPVSATPFIFIASGISSVLVFLLYSLATGRVSGERLVVGTQVLLLAIALVLWLLLGTPAGSSFALLLALFLFADSGSTLIVTQFWVRAAQIFDPREAKRLFGLMAAGGTAASMLVGLALRAGLGTALGVENLLLVVSAAILVCIVCARVLSRIGRETQDHVPVAAVTLQPGELEPGRTTIFDDLRTIGRAPLLLLITGLTILVALLVNTSYYQWFLALQAIYAGRSQEMVAFLGGYEFLVAAAALVVQLSLSSRVLRRWGIFIALLFFPLATALGGVLVLATGGTLLAMVLVRAGDPVFRSTINQSAITMLYLPVPDGLRQRAKTILEIAYAFSFGLLGVAFLASQRVPGWTYVTWAIPLLGFAAAYLALLGWGRPQYRRALAANLKKRRLDFAHATIDITDEAMVQVLADALRGPDDLLVVHTLDLIDQAPKVDWTPYVIPLLRHPSPAVRILALGHLGRAGGQQHQEPVAALLAAAEADVRAAAVEALAAIGAPGISSRVAPLLDDASPAVRGAALLALARYGGPEWDAHIAAELRAFVTSDDPSMRREGARVIAALGRPENGALLGPLLAHDASTRERAAALAAAGVLRSRGLLPLVIAALGDSRVAADAVNALVCYGPGVEGDLDAGLRDGRLPRACRAHIPQALGRLKTPAATTVLASHLQDSDEAVRSAIYAACAANWQVGTQLKDELRGALSSEIRGYYQRYVWRADLAALADGALLGEALGRRLDRSLDHICLLLRMLYPGEQLAGLRQTLESGQAIERSMAIEMLDTLLAGEDRSLLVPALEAPASQVLTVAEKRLGIKQKPVAARLAEMVAGDDPWLRTCALLGRDKRGDAMDLSIIERLLFFKSTDFFGQLSSEDLAPLAKCAQTAHYDAGQTLVRQGEAGACLFLIVDGEVAIVVRRQQVSVRGPKDVIGEMALLLRRSRSADCVALTDVTALRIEYDDFWELMTERPALAAGIVKVLAGRLDEATESLQKASQKL
jgi:HEAT repeat protein